MDAGICDTHLPSSPCLHVLSAEIGRARTYEEGSDAALVFFWRRYTTSLTERTRRLLL